MAARLVPSVRTMRQVRGFWSRYFLTVFLDSPTLMARTMKSFSMYSWLIFSTSGASGRQYPHQVVQNSSRTTLPLMETFEKDSPEVDLALKRGAGSFVLVLASRLAQTHRPRAKSAEAKRLRTRLDAVCMAGI